MSDFKIRSKFLVKCMQCNFANSSAVELFEAVEVAQGHLEEFVDRESYEFKNDGHELEITETKLVRRSY